MVFTCINIKLPTPTPAPVDSDDSDGIPPFFGDVVFLSSFDGADGSTAATDDSLYAHTISFHDNAQIDTAQSKFGGASLLVDGGSGFFDRVTCPTAAEFDLGASSFTIECFLRLANVGLQIGTIAGVWESTIPNLCYRFDVSGTNLLFQSGNGAAGGPTLSVAHGMSVDTQYHVACERNESGLVRLYRDGVVLGSSTNTNTFGTPSTPFHIGSRADGGPLKVHIDELRFARRPWYDGAFTPPSAPFDRP